MDLLWCYLCPQSSTNQDDTLIETPRWPYEEEELLSYIDNEELPVVLLDLLETEHSCLFYSGCIIAQIRDYRQAYPSFLCDTHHVLLRPTNQVCTLYIIILIYYICKLIDSLQIRKLQKFCLFIFLFLDNVFLL